MSDPDKITVWLGPGKGFKAVDTPMIPPEPKGWRIGDAVAFVTRWTGISAVVKALKPDCKCEERRRRLNQIGVRKSCGSCGSKS